MATTSVVVPYELIRKLEREWDNDTDGERFVAALSEIITHANIAASEPLSDMHIGKGVSCGRCEHWKRIVDKTNRKHEGWCSRISRRDYTCVATLTQQSFGCVYFKEFNPLLP